MGRVSLQSPLTIELTARILLTKGLRRFWDGDVWDSQPHVFKDTDLTEITCKTLWFAGYSKYMVYEKSFATAP